MFLKNFEGYKKIKTYVKNLYVPWIDGLPSPFLKVSNTYPMKDSFKIPDKPVCLECGDPILYGRSDRKFCSDTCKNRYHNRQNHYLRSLQLRVIGALEKNYTILSGLVRSGVTSISLGDLAQLGYNTAYVTSYHKVGRHNEYRCFDIKYCCTSTRIFGIERVRPGGG